MKQRLLSIIEDPKAFTLVELLLGILIASIIGLSAFNVFWTGIKVDAKLRWVQDRYKGVFMLDEYLSRDLENAVRLDLSGSYPDLKIFDGKNQSVEFIAATAKGLRRVKYFTGPPNAAGGLGDKEYLLRQEMALPAWADHAAAPSSPDVLIRGIDKGSFRCRYAPYAQDIREQGLTALAFHEEWQEDGLPMAVSCSFSLYDPKHPGKDTVFTRTMFTAPLWGPSHAD